MSLRVGVVLAGLLVIFSVGATLGMIAGRSFDAPAKRPSAAVSLAVPEVPYEVPVKAYRGRSAHGPTPPAPQQVEPPVHPSTQAKPPQPPPQATVTHPEPARPPRDGAPGAEAPPTEAQVAILPMPLRPAWLRNAVPSPDPGQKPMIAVVVDDMGIDQKRSRRAIALPAPLTLAFIPYGYHLPELTEMAHAAGHELLVHLPMEPLDADADPGPNALLTSLSHDEIMRRLRWGLTRFDGYVGLNNHMGSKFSAWPEGMMSVLAELKARGLLFLDSRTSPNSIGDDLARRMGVPHVGRDVFLDNIATEAAVRKQLAELEELARRRGHAVGIGHPHDATIAALAKWLPDAAARGFLLVPVSAIVRRTQPQG